MAIPVIHSLKSLRITGSSLRCRLSPTQEQDVLGHPATGAWRLGARVTVERSRAGLAGFSGATLSIYLWVRSRLVAGWWLRSRVQPVNQWLIWSHGTSPPGGKGASRTGAAADSCWSILPGRNRV